MEGDPRTRIVAWLDVEQDQIHGSPCKVKVQLVDGSWVEGFVCETCPADLARQIADEEGKVRQAGLKALGEN